MEESGSPMDMRAGAVPAAGTITGDHPLKRGRSDLGDGFRAAATRLAQIAGWALVAATVALVLWAIESRSERVGEIVAGLLGMAWSAVPYFVVPVIVIERTGPVDAFRRPVSILRRTWGEALSANFGVGFALRTSR
jgi:hypothetical protein